MAAPPGSASSPVPQKAAPEVPTLYGETDHSVPAHWGYVYALAWVEDPKREGSMWLASGSGGGDVKVRLRLQPGQSGPEERLTFAIALPRSGIADQTARSSS